MKSQDVLALMIRELQTQAFTVPLYDADQRETWFRNCGQVLAAITDPQERFSQMNNFALGLALRGVPSALVLGRLERPW